MYILTLCFLCYSLMSVNSENPRVTINDGELEGTMMKTKNGREINVFLGIPYAEPPIGKLRFKSPVPRKPWKGTLDATKSHTICPQRIFFIDSEVMGNENCLYLNVYAPKIPSANSKLLPVMVFIHGGGFLFGTGRSESYSPGYLLDQEIVLVTLNYRLGALGFLSTDDDASPGNYGLKDQALALKWVNKNIKYFGGDPSSVTLFGESAGAVSAHYHIFSPMSKGLFHGVISQSGTVFNIWAVIPEGRNIKSAKKLAESVGCSTTTNMEMVECLRNVDALKLVDERLFSVWNEVLPLPFRPTVEPPSQDAFLADYPAKLFEAKKFNDVPFMTGITKDEGLLTSSVFVNKPESLEKLSKNFNNMTAFSLWYDHVDDSNKISEQLQTFYLGDKGSLTIDDFPNLIKMHSDVTFTRGLDQSVRMHLRESKKPIFTYLFAYQSESSFSELINPGKIYGVSHGDELLYLFPMGDTMLPHRKETDTDKKVMKLMTSYWTNFAKTGNPTPTTDDLITAKWEPVQSDKLEHLLIDAEIQEMKDELLPDRVKFCRQLPLEQNKVQRDEL
ncbi:hypothetical protein HHI36_005363 [Cryptolaemus montrouzieri]|uniref:Carboxylic ester hydrolase n=1 Tax=Cryptolaemus montrouzieri TaxID=559131 RepID=A0ABD2NTX2_9CUCU